MGNQIKPIICVITSNGVKGSTGIQTGFWLSELTHPLDQFEEADLTYEIFSVMGGESPIDNQSMDLGDLINSRFISDNNFMQKIKNTKSINEANPDDYSAIFFAGGHGPMWDFPNCEAIHDIIRKMYESGKPVAAVCHGPSALFNVQLSNKDYLIKGKKLTSFTNNEEKENQTTTIVPFLLETELSNHQALFQESPNWSENVIVDGNLITGQNPASAAGVGKKIADLLLK